MPMHNGVKYFETSEQAQGLIDSGCAMSPDARIVEFERGFAVQYRVSGGYYPQPPSNFDLTGHWDLRSALANTPAAV